MNLPSLGLELALTVSAIILLVGHPLHSLGGLPHGLTPHPLGVWGHALTHGGSWLLLLLLLVGVELPLVVVLELLAHGVGTSVALILGLSITLTLNLTLIGVLTLLLGLLTLWVGLLTLLKVALVLSSIVWLLLIVLRACQMGGNNMRKVLQNQLQSRT